MALKNRIFPSQLQNDPQNDEQNQQQQQQSEQFKQSQHQSNIKKSHQQPLFHPSKIQMSSTPIKTSSTHQPKQYMSKKIIQTDPSQASTPIKETSPSKTNLQKPEQLLRLLEHDTPIKGHKLKSFDSQATAIVDKYLSRIGKLSKKNDNSSDDNSIKMKDFQQKMLLGTDNIPKKDDKLKDDSSKIKISIPEARPSTPTKTPPPQPPPTSLLNQADDDSLLRLRQKQKSLLQSRHRLLLDQSQQNLLNQSKTRQQEIFSSSSTDISLGSKLQLKSYVQSLESKLQSLRAEMDTSFHAAHQHIDQSNQRISTQQSKLTTDLNRSDNKSNK